MKYVFIDTEGGVDDKSGLKTVGIVAADENLAVLEKREVYIDAVGEGIKSDGIDVKRERPFNQMYCVLRDFLTAADGFVIGYGVQHDIKKINAACERFKTPPLAFNFFDVQGLYNKLFSVSGQISLRSCVKALGIKEWFNYHTSKADALAALCVMQKLCEREQMTVAELAEKYPEFTGRAENYMMKFTHASTVDLLAKSSANLFKIRVDFPLVCFKKKIGAMRDDGYRDGICIYYDPNLNRLFKDRHPHRVAKAYADNPVYECFGETERCGLIKLKEEEPSFYNADAALDIRRFIVSYECVGRLSCNTLTLLHGNKYLKQVDSENSYVKKLLQAKIDPNELICRYYTAETFLEAMRKNAKWNYGEKNADIAIDVCALKDIRLQEGDALYLPRAYACILTDELKRNDIVACPQEHIRFASANEVRDINGLQLADSAVKLIAQEADGSAYAFIPVIKRFNFALLDGTYELPLLVKRRLDDNYFKRG